MALKLAKVITNEILSEIDEWKSRLLQEIYPILFIDAVHFSVRQDNVVKKLAAYVVLGISEDGLKSRGIRDSIVICADGLSEMKEAIATAFPDTEYQRCIVHQRLYIQLNAIESLNSTYLKLNSRREVFFPNGQALIKSLYLSSLRATKK